ncbi:MAG: flagellar hook-basal body complex protein FliE [Clostridiales bacterium]|nr:flagellar hook-basal body complex protein FliE [Clostridiales bacterium]
MPPVSSLGAVTPKSESSSTTSKTELPFSEVIREAYRNLTEQQEIAAMDAFELALGETDDLHTLMINAEKASIALELTVQLTSKALNAYNEIMRMQI